MGRLKQYPICEHPADGRGPSARSVMAEGVFGRPLKQPLYVFRDDLLFIPPLVSLVKENDSPPRSMAESLCWLLETSGPKKGAYDDTIHFFSPSLMHQTDDDQITWTIAYSQLLEQIEVSPG